MDSSSKAARPYAIAAFRQASDEGKLDQWSEMLALLEIVIADPDVTRLIDSPEVADAQVSAFIIDVCGDRLSDPGGNFVRVLSENRRLGQIQNIAAGFEAERARAEHRNEVSITSAFPLSDAETNTITEAMAKHLGTRVDVQVDVDPALIGGVVIRSGDTVIDASIRGRLNQMAQSIA